MRAWTRWVALATRTESGVPMALFRIALGLTLVIWTGTLLWGADVLDPLYTPVAEGGFARAEQPHLLVQWMGGHSRAGTLALAWAGTLGSVALAAGLGGRLTAFLLLQVLLALHSLPDDIGGGYDRLLANGLILLVLGNGTATHSLDCRLRTGGWTSDRLVYAFPRDLAVLQLVLLYTATGFAKQGIGWQSPFYALYRAMLKVPYVRAEYDWVAHLGPLLSLSTVVALVWEKTFAVVGLWFGAKQGFFGERARRWAVRWDLRWIYLGLGVVMHVTLFATMDLGPFSAASVAFYVAFFDPPPRSS